MLSKKTTAGALAAAALSASVMQANASQISYRFEDIDGLKIFYREAGDPAKPTIALFHGFPSSSHMFRDLIPKLSDDFHVLAPDYPGMGNSDAPAADRFSGTFDNVASVLEKFLERRGAKRFIVYMQDFGGPVGMRIATKHPDWISGLVVQNTLVTLEGWDPARLKAVQANAGPVTPEKRAAVESRVVLNTAIFLYQHGARNPAGLNPDAWTNDAYALSKPENRRIITDLQLDIPSSIELYPKWKTYLQQNLPRTLIVWGKGDPIFTVDGAEAIKKIVPAAEIHYFDSGHFALEEDSEAIARDIIRFFANRSEK